MPYKTYNVSKRSRGLTGFANPPANARGFVSHTRGNLAGAKFPMKRSAKSLAHPQRKIAGDQRVGTGTKFGVPTTFNGVKTRSDAPPLPRTKVSYKPAAKPVTKSARTVPLAKSTPPFPATSSKKGFGARFKAALGRSAQTQKVKALQRQHKYARKG